MNDIIDSLVLYTVETGLATWYVDITSFLCETYSVLFISITTIVSLVCVSLVSPRMKSRADIGRMTLVACHAT